MNWEELPTKLKIYISTLSIFGLLIASWAAWNLVSQPHNAAWVVLFILVLITVPFSLFLESVDSAVGIGDAYIMAIAMLYGVAPCIMATFCQSFIISLFGQRQRRYTYRIFFNTSSTICGAWIYSTIFNLINPSRSYDLTDVMVPAAVLAATFFFVNSTLTSVAIAWSLNKSILKFWANTCMPLAIDYSISSLCATALVVLHYANQYYILVAAPAILVVWAWNKYQQARHMQTQTHLRQQEQLYLRTVESLALAVDAKDQTTYGHIRRVKAYAMGLAKFCGIKDLNELKAIETGSLLHDIGKIAIEDYILNKPGRLSKKEFEKVKMHAAAGDEILQQVCFPFPVAKYVRYHHERWDGLGYPDGLKGEAIPLGARILAIADAFDAIRFSRPYKLSISTDEAIEILRDQAGIVYDPSLIKIFTSHIDELEQTAIKESENVPQLSFRKYSETIDKTFPKEPVNSTTLQNIPAELVQLAELCSIVSGYLRLTDLFPMISRRLHQLIPFSTCIFYIKNPNNRVEATYVSGKYSELLQGHAMDIGKGISGWVAAYRKPMVNANPALDFQGINSDLTSLTDAVVVPIVEKDESLGTISLYAQESMFYGQDELTILQALANILAPVISEEVKNGPSVSQNLIDPTTGVHRVSYLTAMGPQLISSSGNSRAPICLIIFDLKNLHRS